MMFSSQEINDSLIPVESTIPPLSNSEIAVSSLGSVKVAFAINSPDS